MASQRDESDGGTLRSTELTAIPETEIPNMEFDDVLDESTEGKEESGPPVHVVMKDNKRAWGVCVAAFLTQIIVMGNIHVFGLYFVSFLNEFKSTKATTGQFQFDLLLLRRTKSAASRMESKSNFLREHLCLEQN